MLSSYGSFVRVRSCLFVSGLCTAFAFALTRTWTLLCCVRCAVFAVFASMSSMVMVISICVCCVCSFVTSVCVLRGSAGWCLAEVVDLDGQGVVLIMIVPACFGTRYVVRCFLLHWDLCVMGANGGTSRLITNKEATSEYDMDNFTYAGHHPRGVLRLGPGSDGEAFRSTARTAMDYRDA